MSHYDPATTYTTAADESGASNNIINATTNKTGILVHKVALRQTGATGSGALAVLINDDTTIGTTNHRIAVLTSSEGAVAANEYPRYKSEDFNPPVPFHRGLSVDVTGTGVSVTVYYTRM